MLSYSLVVVETHAGLATQVACRHYLAKKGTRPVSGITQFPVQYLHYVESYIQADEIG